MTDGLWKLTYPICFYKVPVIVEGMKISLPDCCPRQPLHGKPFCEEHGVPSDFVGFLGHLRKCMQDDENSLLSKFASCRKGVIV